jgi:prepilin-type N-terminal cleavage/methylation domain-containing protein
MSRRNRRAGFTLLEICLVIAIALIVLSTAVPSVRGLFAEQRLKRTFEDFDAFVQKTKVRAMTERRAFVLIWDGQGITVQPDEPKIGDEVGEGDYFAFADGTISLERPAHLLPPKEKVPVEWLIWRSGTCEPAILHYEGGAGAWTVKYDPLTVRATFLEDVVK